MHGQQNNKILQFSATETKFQANSACVGMLLQFLKLFCLTACLL